MEQHKKAQPTSIAFAAPESSGGNLNTFFLEIFWYYVAIENSRLVGRQPNQELLKLSAAAGQTCKLRNLISSHPRAIVRATVMISQLLSFRTSPDRPIRKASDHPMMTLPSNAIFYRSWYTTFRQVIRNRERIQSPFYKVP